MLHKVRQLLARPAEAPAAAATIPPGRRVYAVGDVHGRLDLFDRLIDAIEADDSASAPAATTLVLLGDLIDRGPDSAGIVARARDLQQRRDTRILAGNHEEMFLRSLEDTETLRHFLRHGGRETVLSYGVDPQAYAEATLEEVQALIRVAVPAEDIAFLAGLEDMVTIGDYLFVHAGIQPGLPLAEQNPTDLRWIREPFLSHAQPHQRVVVHGHTITERPEDRGNRIGIDTGAFMTGRLTALRLEGDSRRFLAVVEGAGGAILAEPAGA